MEIQKRRVAQLMNLDEAISVSMTYTFESTVCRRKRKNLEHLGGLEEQRNHTTKMTLQSCVVCHIFQSCCHLDC
jgi:hypothetical protein